MCLTADPGVTSLIPAQSHSFMVIDHEISSTVILLPSADSRKVVTMKGDKTHMVIFNGLTFLSSLYKEEKKSLKKLEDELCKQPHVITFNLSHYQCPLLGINIDCN